MCLRINYSCFRIILQITLVVATLYGGQLNECRLYYGTNYSADSCRYDNIAHNGNSDDALGIFMHISRIHIESESKLNISSQADLFKFCEDERLLNDPIKLYPGEEFNVTFIVFDQLGSPVQTTVF